MMKKIAFINQSTFACITAKSFFDAKPDTSLIQVNDIIGLLSQSIAPDILIVNTSMVNEQMVISLKSMYPNLKVIGTKENVTADNILEYNRYIDKIIKEPIDYVNLYEILDTL